MKRCVAAWTSGFAVTRFKGYYPAFVSCLKSGYLRAVWLIKIPVFQIFLGCGCNFVLINQLGTKYFFADLSQKGTNSLDKDTDRL